MPKFTARAHLHRLLTSCAHVPARAWVAGFSALRRALYQVSYQHTCRALRRRMAFTPSSSKTSLRVSAGGRRPRRTGEQLAAEASTICSTRGGTRTRNLLLRREAPYPLGHTSRRILLPLKRIVLKICVASVARAMCQTRRRSGMVLAPVCKAQGSTPRKAPLRNKGFGIVFLPPATSLSDLFAYMHSARKLDGSCEDAVMYTVAQSLTRNIFWSEFSAGTNGRARSSL